MLTPAIAFSIAPFEAPDFSDPAINPGPKAKFGTNPFDAL